MFKSLFSKYISAFLVINLFSFAVIISVITSIINGYSQKTQKDELKMIALSSREYIYNQIDMLETDSLEHAVSSSKKNIESIFTALSSNTDEVTTIITDGTGKILSTFGSYENSLEKTSSLPASFIEFFKSKGTEDEFLSINNSENTYHIF